jgi:hypothetical protein
MKTIEVECKKPEGIGLDIVDMKYVEVKKIQRHSGTYFDNAINGMAVKNIVRPEGITESYVQKFRRIIKNGKYDPLHHVPPVVLETEEKDVYDSLTGEHRYIAHKDEDEKKMWVAICRFEDVEGMPAEYWASTYQSNENNPEDRVDNNVRTDDGTISATKNQIERKWITSSEKDLRKSLKHQQIKGSKKIQNLINRIQSDYGMKGSVRLTTNEDCKRACHEYEEKEPTMVKSMNNKAGIDPDYDYRFWKEIVDKLKEDPNAMIDAAFYFVGMNATEVVTAREGKEKYSLNILCYYAQKFLEYYHDGTFEKQVNIKYFGQLDGEGLYAE